MCGSVNKVSGHAVNEYVCLPLLLWLGVIVSVCLSLLVPGPHHIEMRQNYLNDIYFIKITT